MSEVVCALVMWKRALGTGTKWVRRAQDRVSSVDGGVLCGGRLAGCAATTGGIYQTVRVGEMISVEAKDPEWTMRVMKLGRHAHVGDRSLKAE